MDEIALQLKQKVNGAAHVEIKENMRNSSDPR
jgi:hypothetical protein